MKATAQDSSWLKARLVARVLSSSRLRESARWCRLAQRLVDDPGVTNRLVDQAMRWFALKNRSRNNKPGQ